MCLLTGLKKSRIRSDKGKKGRNPTWPPARKEKKRSAATENKMCHLRGKKKEKEGGEAGSALVELTKAQKGREKKTDGAGDRPYDRREITTKARHPWRKEMGAGKKKARREDWKSGEATASSPRRRGETREGRKSLFCNEIL